MLELVIGNPDCPIKVVRTWQGRGSERLFF